MSLALDADIIVIGGGCAGLSLARALVRRQTSARVIVLEARTEYSNDRTWCFWAGAEHENVHLVTHRWNAWRFTAADRSVVQTGVANGPSYQCIPALNFYEDALASIEQSTVVELKLGVEMCELVARRASVAVDTSIGRLSSRWVVDTRPPGWLKHSTNQFSRSFLGVEIQTERACFNKLVVGLMDNMTVDELGFRFTYLLPFSGRRALVEETRFTDRPVSRRRLAEDLEDTLSDLPGTEVVDILRRERGRIPMTTKLASREDRGRIVRAGTGGGAVRASTGHAFARIQRWAIRCAESLLDGRGPIAHPRDPAWRLAADRLFLNVIRAQPELAPNLFMTMGRHLPASTLIRFLSDGCRLSDLAQVANVLPKRPFLRELVLTPRKGSTL